MGENALKFVKRLETMQQGGKTTSEVTDEENTELVDQIQSFQHKAQNLVKGKIFEFSEFATKAYKEKGIQEMFAEVLDIQPETAVLSQMIQFDKKQDREFLKPLKDQNAWLIKIQKDLKCYKLLQNEKLKKNTDIIVLNTRFEHCSSVSN